MKKSITEVYQQFYRKNLRNLFVLNLAIIGALVALLIFNAVDKSYNNARNVIETNKTYLTGLILAGSEDTVEDFLKNENRKSEIHFFKFEGKSTAIDTEGMKSVPLYLGNEKLGTLYFGIRISKAIPWVSILMLIIVSVIFTFFMKMALDRASKFLEQNIVLPLKSLSSSIQGSSSVLDLSLTKNHSREVMEISLIQDAFIEFTGKLIDSEVAIARTKVAQQVAHDIRSPLSALEMISSNLAALEEDKRLIIRNSINRIRDIANTLSKDQRPKLENKPESSREITLLSSVIEMMVTEKRYEISKKNNIDIVFDQSSESYGLFANAVIPEMKRILSNLLNNSIEAIGDRKGKIEISLQSNQNGVVIEIQDNGCGMSPSDLKRVVQEKVSLKRREAKGLGLSHALDTIESWGGNISIESMPNAGTKVRIELKQESAPEWFIDAIDLSNLKNVVVFDDDETIHQMWDSRLEPYKKQNDIIVHHFKDHDSLEKFYGKNFADLDPVLFLVDYEIHGESNSGLDLIEFLGIQDQSILVTSHYEDEGIRARCQKLGMGMIPKNMAGFVNLKASKIATVN